MDGPNVLLTGFGAFEEVLDNPSGCLARELDGHPLARGQIVGALLPVSFERGPRELEALVERVRPVAILATGVHSGQGFRLERGAGVSLAPDRPDSDGVDARDLAERQGAWMGTGFDLEGLRQALASACAGPVQISGDAGGYVCEAVYRRALEVGQATSTPSLFLHLPPFDCLPHEVQRAALLAVLNELSLQADALGA